MMIPVQGGVPLRDQLPRKPGEPEPRKVPSALVEAVRAEMTALVQGDIGDDPLALARIEQFAQQAHNLFAVVRGKPRSDVYGGANVVAYGAYGSMTTGFNANPEQFGARAIRELVGLLPEILGAQKKESLAEIAEAMKIAKEEGDDELRLALREKLMGKSGKSDGIVEAKAITTGSHENHVHTEAGKVDEVGEEPASESAEAAQ